MVEDAYVEKGLHPKKSKKVEQQEDSAQQLLGTCFAMDCRGCIYGRHIGCCNIVFFTLGIFMFGAVLSFAIIYGASVGVGIARS